MNSETPQKPRTIRWSIVIITLLIFGLCIWLTVRTVSGGPEYPTFMIPGQADISLPEPGTYTVFCARPANVSVSMEDFSPPEILWSIQDAQNAALTLKPYGGSLRVNETVAIGTIDIPAAGNYRFAGSIPETDRQYEISFGKGMARTVATVVVCIVVALASLAFLFIYLVICLIRRLARTPAAK